MSFIQPGSVAYGDGQIVNVGTSATAATLPVKSKQVIFTNLGTNPVFVRMAPSGGNATTSDACIPANMQVTYTKFEEVTAISLIATGAATNVHIIPAEGF